MTTALLLGGAALSLTTGFPAGAQVAQNDAREIQTVAPRAGAPASFADLVQQLQPAVVNISTRQRVKVAAQANPFAGTPFADLFGGQDQGGGNGPQTREAQSLGSGFIISADGFVVTNNHVITADGQGEVETITVTMPDGTEFPAKLIGRDVASDLAVLKITSTKALPFVRFGDSASARVGDWILAIGNPFGLGGSVSAGILSAVTRTTGSGAYDRYLQTDAAINRGNSGGPMFDMKGQVIGINNAIYSPTGGSVGIGFAIPAETAAPIVERLKRGQTIERGFLGVRVQQITEDLADSLGIPHNRGEFVQAVEPGKGAALAGLQPGDVVLKVAGRQVTPQQSLSFIVANTAPGTRIPIELLREGRQMTVTALVGRRPSEEELAQQQAFDPDPQADADNPFNNPPKRQGQGLAEQSLGLSVLPLTPQIARQLGATDTTHGVVVNAIDASSDAAAKGLQRGDIILSANNRPVVTVADLETAVRAAKASSRSALLLRVQRGGRPATYVAIRLR